MVEGQSLWLKDYSELSGSQLIAQSKFQKRVLYTSFPTKFGVVAQLVEHLLCKQGVVGSNPSGSTNLLGLDRKGGAPFLTHGLIAQLVRARA